MKTSGSGYINTCGVLLAEKMYVPVITTINNKCTVSVSYNLQHFID